MQVSYTSKRDFSQEQVISLYSSVDWSSARKPELLMAALRDSHHVITAWSNSQLIGLGNAISDGHLVVYYPHLIVRPEFQYKGVGSVIVEMMRERYKNFHQHSLLADGGAVNFYEKQGFSRAGSCVPMWIYDGDDHD